MRTKKKIEKPEETKVEVAPIFKLKVTNLKKTLYSGELVETDILGIKVGDNLRKGNSIFVVDKIERGNFKHEENLAYWKNYSKGLGNGYMGYTPAEHVNKFAEKYTSSGGYGVCKVTVRKIMQGMYPYRAKRIVIINEFLLAYGKYVIVDFDNLSDCYTREWHSIQKKINKLQAKAKAVSDTINTLAKYCKENQKNEVCLQENSPQPSQECLDLTTTK